MKKLVGGAAVIIAGENLLDGLSGIRFVHTRCFDINDSVHGGGQKQDADDAARISEFVAALQKNSGVKSLGDTHQSGRRSKMQSGIPTHEDL